MSPQSLKFHLPVQKVEIRFEHNKGLKDSKQPP